jgi:hypothetical protein
MMKNVKAQESLPLFLPEDWLKSNDCMRSSYPLMHCFVVLIRPETTVVFAVVVQAVSDSEFPVK